MKDNIKCGGVYTLFWMLINAYFMLWNHLWGHPLNSGQLFLHPRLHSLMGLKPLNTYIFNRNLSCLEHNANLQQTAPSTPKNKGPYNHQGSVIYQYCYCFSGGKHTKTSVHTPWTLKIDCIITEISIHVLRPLKPGGSNPMVVFNKHLTSFAHSLAGRLGTKTK